MTLTKCLTWNHKSDELFCGNYISSFPFEQVQPKWWNWGGTWWTTTENYNFGLTLTDWTKDISFKLWMLLKHGCETLSSELGRSLPTMTIEDGKAAIVAGSSEVVLHHILTTDKWRVSLLILKTNRIQYSKDQRYNQGRWDKVAIREIKLSQFLVFQYWNGRYLGDWKQKKRVNLLSTLDSKLFAASSARPYAFVISHFWSLPLLIQG